MNRKTGVFLTVVFLCLVCIVGTQLLLDTEGPQIDYPSDYLTVACSLSYEDLLKEVEVTDRSGVRELFVEESDLNEIVANHKLTYVAIDNFNNVSKRQVGVRAEQAVGEFHISQLKDAVFEVGEPYDLDDYFTVSNGCGWRYPADLQIEGLKLEEVGEYDAMVYVSDDSTIDPLSVRAVVLDSFSPRITLKYEELELMVNEYFDYRLAIKELSDDKDDYDFLYESLEIDGDVDVTSPGQYILTFRVHDSTQRVAEAELKVIVKEINMGE